MDYYVAEGRARTEQSWSCRPSFLNSLGPVVVVLLLLGARSSVDLVDHLPVLHSHRIGLHLPEQRAREKKTRVEASQ